MTSIVLKRMIPILDNTWPNCCFYLSQKLNLSQPVWNFLVKTNDIIWPVGPLHSPSPPPQKEEAVCMAKTLAIFFPQNMSSFKNNPLSFANDFFAAPFFPVKTFLLVQTVERPSSCWMGCCPSPESLIRKIRSSCWVGWILFFNKGNEGVSSGGFNLFF